MSGFSIQVTVIGNSKVDGASEGSAGLLIGQQLKKVLASGP